MKLTNSEKRSLEIAETVQIYETLSRDLKIKCYKILINGERLCAGEFWTLGAAKREIMSIDWAMSIDM